MAARPLLLLPRVPLHGQGRGSGTAGQRKSCIPLNDRPAPYTNIYPDFPGGRKVKFRLFVPSGCQKSVFALQTYFKVYIRLTPCLLTGRDFQDNCPLLKRARRIHTDIYTHASALRQLRRWNFPSTTFKASLDLLSKGIIEVFTYFNGASTAEVPLNIQQKAHGTCYMSLLLRYTQALAAFAGSSGDGFACLLSHLRGHSWEHKGDTGHTLQDKTPMLDTGRMLPSPSLHQMG